MREWQTLKWFWDDDCPSGEAFIVDRNGFVILAGLDPEVAKALVKRHNQDVRDAWANEELEEKL